MGITGDHLGGSHWTLVNEIDGGLVPTVDAQLAKTTFAQMHAAIAAGLIRSCHDMSEGGLAAAVAEMAFAGGLGANVDASSVGLDLLAYGEDEDVDLSYVIASVLFGESNTRFVVEVEPDKATAFEAAFDGVEIVKLGEVITEPVLTIKLANKEIIKSDIASLKAAWQKPLDW